jgi:hypothetical protein
MSGSPERSYSPQPHRCIKDLTTPQPWGMPPPDVFDAHLLEIENEIRPSVPHEIRRRIGVSRNLAVYGGFCYDFISVSAFWSLTCVEMALWLKFAELHPGEAANHKRSTFGSLAKWAVSRDLVGSPDALNAMLKLRNSFAHPKEFSPVWNPAMAVEVFQSAVEIVNSLWPLEAC